MKTWAATPREMNRGHLPVQVAGSVQLPGVRSTGMARRTCRAARRRLGSGNAAVAHQEIGIWGADAESQEQVASQSSQQPPE